VSLFDIETVTCPACAASVEFEAVGSVNADRRPDLRAAIVDGSFQVQPCPSCGKQFRLDPVLTYIDIGNRQWILVQPAEALAQWSALEQQARATFSQAFGDAAPRPARAIGSQLRVRVAFGWPALREKLLCADNFLDDVSLELMKCALLRGLPNAPMTDDTELRLVGATPETLQLAWLKTANDAPVETLDVPRALYDDVNDDAWQALRATLEDGPFVDIHRLLVDAEAAEG
jgi:hypothetical protein